MRSVSRRALLGGVAGSGIGLAVAGCQRSVQPEAATIGSGSVPARAPARGFHGVHQVGVQESPAEFALLAAFRCVDRDRAGLARTLRALSTEAANLVEGRVPVPRDAAFPPADTGLIEAESPARLAVTVSVGASLFDSRFGLSQRRPRELTRMPFLANDRLDPARTHGDLLVGLQADRPDLLQHGLRQVMRSTRSGLVLHWLLDGYSRRDAAVRPGRTDNRNLMGFKDGSANLDGSDEELMRRLVWVGESDGEPSWARGGSYLAVRVIRMFVEQWDRASLREQERLIGRHKLTGAPLGAAEETEEPRYHDDPHGSRTPLDAHIRLANPRTAATQDQRLLRRGFNYTRGFDGAGQLDQGLAFASYSRRLANFLAVQERLRGEPLEEYTLPEGGGFYFVLPGARDEADWLGRTLLEA